MIGDPGLEDGEFRPLAEINVTPFVDVMLVLLVIFMVTAPLLATGVKVDLPAAATAQALNPKEPFVVGVDKDGRLSFGADEVTLDGLVEILVARNADDPGHVVRLRGDKAAPLGRIVEVMDRLAARGLARIAIAARKDASPSSGPPK